MTARLRDRASRAISAGLLVGAAALGGWGGCLDPARASRDGGPGSEAWVAYARAAPDGQRDLCRVRLDGSGGEALSSASEDEVPVALLRDGRILAEVAGEGWEALAAYGTSSGQRSWLTPRLNRAEVVSALDFTILFAMGRDQRTLSAIDWRDSSGDPRTLFPDLGGGEKFLAVTEDGWVVALTKGGEMAASLLGPAGPRVVTIAGVGASYERLTHDGRVIYAAGGRLFVADPDGSGTWEVPGGEGAVGAGWTKTLAGLTSDDTLLFTEGGRLHAVRPGEDEPAVLLDGLPEGFQARVDDKDWVVAVLGTSLVRFSPRPEEVPSVLAGEPEPIEFLRLHSTWAYYTSAGTLKSARLDGAGGGILSERASEIRQILFLPDDNVTLVDERDTLTTSYADGSGATVLLEGERLRGVQVLGGGKLLIEVDRGGQGDILATAGPFSTPYPIADSTADEGEALLLP